MGARVPIAALAALAALLLAGLGVWQIERRAWKLELIARTDARLHAPAVPPPATAGPDDAYLRIRAAGEWLPGPPALVKAVTSLGSGWWAINALRTPAGTILVNRGFVPDAARGASAPATGPATVEGLLRLSEPGGAFLRRNQPGADRWFSRDVAAIARARGWPSPLPYFIDADASPGAAWPRGGLTVVRFANNHLIYAVTWFALSGLAAFFAWRVLRGPTVRQASA